MRRNPRTKMPPEEDYARMLEDGLVYLTCCRVGAARRWCPAALNMTHSFDAIATDRPEGRDRRSALRHWVRAHTRVLHGAAGREVSVRAHLRGAETFDWFGLRGHVHAPEAEPPPQPDARPDSG